MKMLRKITAFILAFSLLAGTVAAMSAAVYTDRSSLTFDESAPFYDEDAASLSAHESDEIALIGAKKYVPRLTAPEADNPYYYSDLNIFWRYGWGMPNCTCYAWGRAYEILGEEPALCVYSAYLWYDYNKDNAIYAYGDEPRPGAIACWVYTSGISGHVAVVEKVEGDTITFSNSAYSGIEFYTHTAPTDDPSNGNPTWIFQGYIYIGEFESDPAPADKPSDSTETVSETPDIAAENVVIGDVYRITSEDGVNLRSKPGTNYPVIGGITYGQTALVTETKTAGGYTWGHTLYDGAYGWFVTDFAEKVYTKTETPAVSATTDNPDEKAQRTLLMGDLDDDGDITILDATRVQMVLAKLMTPTDYMLAVGDYDGDSIFSIMDSGRIRRYLAFDVAH